MCNCRLHAKHEVTGCDECGSIVIVLGQCGPWVLLDINLRMALSECRHLFCSVLVLQGYEVRFNPTQDWEQVFK